MSLTRQLPLLGLGLLLGSLPVLSAAPMHKIMLLTGQSSMYHDWTRSSPLVKKYLEETGLFVVDTVTTPPAGADMSGFAPKFSDYAGERR